MKLLICTLALTTFAPTLRDTGYGFVRDMASHGPITAVLRTVRRSSVCEDLDGDLGDSDADLVGLYVSRISTVGASWA